MCPSMLINYSFSITASCYAYIYAFSVLDSLYHVITCALVHSTFNQAWVFQFWSHVINIWI